MFATAVPGSYSRAKFSKSMNAKLSLAVLLLLFIGFSPLISFSQQPQTTFKAEVALVNVIFSAADKHGKAVSGLTANDFELFEDKQPQKIEYFSELNEKSDVPLTVALLIDTSGSVKSKLAYEQETAAEFFRKIIRQGKDLALIIQFDSDVNLVQDFTDDQNLLLNALKSLEAGNSTSLRDAIYLAAEEKLKGEAGRKVIVVITDGEDTASKVSKEQAIEAAQKADATIYGIGVASEFGVDFGILKKFAEDTGGDFFSPRARFSDVQAAFQAIGQDLNNRYSLAYTSNYKKKDGSFHAIHIRCKVSGVRVRSRKGYYSPRGSD
jgi:Ca-activated chloride channel homolog